MLKLLRDTGLEMNEIRLSGAERRLHRLRGTRVNNLDPGPVRSLVMRRPTKHDQRLMSVVGDDRLALQLLPREIGIAFAAHQKETIALVDLSEMNRDFGRALFDVRPAGRNGALRHIHITVS